MVKKGKLNYKNWQKKKCEQVISGFIAEKTSSLFSLPKYIKLPFYSAYIANLTIQLITICLVHLDVKTSSRMFQLTVKGKDCNVDQHFQLVKIYHSSSHKLCSDLSTPHLPLPTSAVQSNRPTLNYLPYCPKENHNRPFRLGVQDTQISRWMLFSPRIRPCCHYISWGTGLKKNMFFLTFKLGL